MSKYNSWLYRCIVKPIMRLLGAISWDALRELLTGRRYNLTVNDWLKIITLVGDGYYVILTRKKSHLSTYAVMLGNFITTGRFGHYSHVLMNTEGDDVPFKLVEATSKGVHYSRINDVLNCDSVCILKPKNYSAQELQRCIDFLLDDIGKPYDDLFDLLDQSRMSCVEVVRGALMMLPDYHVRMGNFESMIQKARNLTPQMFYECSDFEVVLEIRR